MITYSTVTNLSLPVHPTSYYVQCLKIFWPHCGAPQLICQVGLCNFLYMIVTLLRRLKPTIMLLCTYCLGIFLDVSESHSNIFIPTGWKSGRIYVAV